MSRVTSKNLFNFKPSGVIDHDVLEFEAKMNEAHPGVASALQDKFNELSIKDDEASNKEFVDTLRGMMAGQMAMLGANPLFVKAGEKTVETEFKVPTTHDGEYDVVVKVYTPKVLQGKKNNAAFLYAHGGGAVGGTAEENKTYLDFMAILGNIVVFNVDYRLAPETKCPNNVKDFYEAIKYVSKNAEALGIDSSKIAIAGDSGGGYICLGAEVLLAQNNETDLVKLAIPGIPMTDDYSFSDPAPMTKEERDSHIMQRKIWKLIASDMDEQKQDPLLFPGKASTELLQKFPATIIWEAEFDMYITEATRMAFKLRAAGRLLEFVVIPGSKHGSYIMPVGKCFKVHQDAFKLAIEEYLHK